MELWKTCIIISVISVTWIIYSFWFNLLLVLLLSPLTYFSCIYVKHLLSLRHFPPGPFPLPIIGNLHMLGPRPHKTFKELSEQYGPVFSVSLGMSRTVIVNTIEPAKEVLVKKGFSFAGRPSTYTMQLMSRGGLSISFADYDSYWTTMSKFGHSTFQGFAKNNKLEELMVIEGEELHKRIKQNEGTPMDPREYVGRYILFIIIHLYFICRPMQVKINIWKFNYTSLLPGTCSSRIFLKSLRSYGIFQYYTKFQVFYDIKIDFVILQ